MPLRSKKSLALIFVFAFVVSAVWGVAKPPKAAAQRSNTSHVCRRFADVVSQGRLPSGYTYVTFEYGVLGNDYGRRFMNSSGTTVADANGAWFNDSGSGCTASGLSALYWDGNTVSYNGGFYQAVFDAAHTQPSAVHDIYLGFPGGAAGNATGYNYCGVANIGWQDAPYGFRNTFGISNCPLAPFASLNDSLRVILGNRTAICMGMAFNVGRSTGANDAVCDRGTSPPDPRYNMFDAAKVYEGGGDFAGHLNGGSAAARNNIHAFYRGAVAAQTPISALDADLRDGSFQLIVFSGNTRDPIPPFFPWNTACQSLAPIAGFCAPPGFPDDPYLNHKASVYVTYILGPPIVNQFSLTPIADTTLNPNDEAPTSVTFASGMTVANSPAGSRVNASINRSFFIRRGATTIPLPPPPGGPGFVTTSFDYPAETRALVGMQLGDQLCVRIVVSPAEGTMAADGTVQTVTLASREREECQQIVAKPYFRVYGGDIIAGAGYTGGASCGNQNAGIISWNRPGGAGPYIGSGGQLGVMAMDIIYEFASGQVRTNSSAAASPKSSTFANVNPSFSSYGAGTYGGGLFSAPGTAPCAPDWYANATGPDPGPTLIINPAPNVIQTLYSNHDLTIPTTNLGAGSRITVYVNGNAFIEGTGVRYQGTGDYANIYDIPSFRLIVRGNIYILPSVSQLDGDYIAQPSNANTGRIYTCGGRPWIARAGLSQYVPDDAAINTTCRTRLTVYGTMTAEVLKLLRTAGTQATSVPNENFSAGGNPGEVFINSAESWLSGGLDTGQGAADGYAPLPPVL
ncbi:MAG TPA: hypothetical protein VK694_02260 [Verrucomicrobiae bacterium]|nr:hypothetical protein [Verrucomicrobiae bacterium]